MSGSRMPAGSGALRGPEYIPLTLEALTAAPASADHNYQVGPESHAHHLAFLEGVRAPLPPTADSCTPFELWGLPRALSANGFLRLNEVVALSGEWLVSNKGIPVRASLKTKVSFESGALRGGLAIAKFRGSTEQSESGRPGLSYEDRILLLRSSRIASLRSAFRRALEQDSSSRLERREWTTLAGPWRLGFRFPWREEEWKNNIHTESFARSLGLEGPLVEAQVLVDLLYYLGLGSTGGKAAGATRLTYRCNAPLLYGREVRVLGSGESGSSKRTLLLAGEREGKILTYLTVTLETAGAI